MPPPTRSTPLDEARALLGVEATTPQEELRRAYLRKVRHFKPEVDPEGFQRLRGAYELLDRVARATAWHPAVPSDDATLDVPTDSSGTEEAASSTVEPDADDSRRAMAPPDTLPTPIAPSATAWHSRVELDETLVLGRALKHAQAGDHAAAEDWLGLALADERPAPLLFKMLEIVLHLQRAGHLAAAERILERIDTRMRGDQDYRMNRSSLELALWTLVHEIQRLPIDFPVGVRSEIINALLEGNPEGALEDLHRLAQRSPATARAAIEGLYPSTNLHKLYSQALGAAAAPAPRVARWNNISAKEMLLAIAIVVGIITVVSLLPKSPLSAPSASTSQARPSTLGYPHRILGPRSQLTATIVEVKEILGVRCPARADGSQPAGCADARAAVLALEQKDCESANEAKSRLAAGGSGTRPLARHLVSRLAGAVILCRKLYPDNATPNPPTSP